MDTKYTEVEAPTPSRTSEARRGHRAQDTRERILRAATAAFAQSGFDGASTRHIAGLAGESHGLLTYHFGTKENLWKEVVRRLFDEFNAELAEHVGEIADADVRTRTVESLRFLVRNAAKRPEVFRLMVQGGTDDSERARWLVEEYLIDGYHFAMAICREAIDAGLIPPAPYIHYQYIIIGAAQLFFAQPNHIQYLTGEDPSNPATIKAHANTLIDLIIR